MHEHLNTPYHQQDTNYYCGAACAQMVLDTVGAGLLDQDDLYADNHSHSTIETNWATGPDGLYWTMNNRQSQRYFALDALDTEDAISRMIAWTIHNYQVAPIALVFGSAHWITVRGYTASDAPTSSIDTGYSIEGFDINNPWPPTPGSPPPPPHSAGDPCGSGGNRGIADEHISYTTWQDDYMTGCDFGHWNGKFIAVCDPEPPPSRLPSERRETPLPTPGDHLLHPEAAIDTALRALEDLGADKRDGWRELLGRTQPERPMLVQRLDRLDSYSWLVPMRGDGLGGAVSVDARSGLYRQAIRLPVAGEEWPSLRDRDEVLRLVVGERFDLPDRQGRLLVRDKGLLSIYPHYVWRPCLESLSPFYPFRMITLGNHRLYIRVDGEVFTSLTLGVHGI